MKIYSCMVFALLVFLVSYSLAVETSQKATDKVEPAAGGGGGNWGGGGGGNWGGGGGGVGCRHGCCYHGRYSCQQCCRSPEEAMAVETSQEATDKVEPADVEPAGGGGGGGNWGGGGGGGGHGGCRHGCCSHGHFGCQQCCRSPEEAKAFADKQAHP